MFGDFFSKSLIINNMEKKQNALKNVANVFDEMDALYNIMREEDNNNAFIVPCNSPVSSYNGNDSDNDNDNSNESGNYIDTDTSYPIINLIPITSDKILFKKPPKTSKDAYYVWKKAGLPHYATKELIESALNKWALKNATIECDSNDSYPIIWNITWKSKTGVSYSSKMTTFIKWMICACSRQGQVS